MNKRIAHLSLAAAAGLWLGAATAQMPHDHHRFAPDVDALHAVLAPIWHARPGKDRLRNACAKAGQMETLAKDIRSADATALQAAIAAMKGKCAAKGGDVDGALYDVHEAFHRLIDAAPAK